MLRGGANLCGRAGRYELPAGLCWPRAAANGRTLAGWGGWGYHPAGHVAGQVPNPCIPAGWGDLEYQPAGREPRRRPSRLVRWWYQPAGHVAV